jgi:uncharacterized phage protein (TIGR02220 family)
MKERKAFNFLRSYYEVFMALTDNKDKLQFLEAILKKQFEGKEPENLTPIANVCYIGQKHALDASLNGYLTKTKGLKKEDHTEDPTEGATEGATEGVSQDPIEGVAQDPTPTPCLQEEEKEKEKEKEEEEVKEEEKEESLTPPTKVEIDFKILLDFINKKTQRSFRTISDKVKKSFKARLKEGYTKEDIGNAINNAIKTQYHIDNNYQYLTPEFFSRSSTLDKYCDTNDVKTLSEEQLKIQKAIELSKTWQTNPYNDED